MQQCGLLTTITVDTCCSLVWNIVQFMFMITMMKVMLLVNVDMVTASDSLCRYDEALCQSLVQHVCKSVGRDLLVRFVVCFLLESNLTSVRWQAHSLVLHIYRFVSRSLALLWHCLIVCLKL